MLRRIGEYILYKTPIGQLIELTKKVHLPGFEGMPLYDVGSFFIKAVRKGSLDTRASSLAFKFFLSIFPFILFLFTLIPYLPIEDFHNTMMDQLRQVLPGDGYIQISEIINDIVNTERTGLLSFGLLLTLYFATNGVMAVMNAFNESALEIEKRNIVVQRLVAILLLLILTVLLIAAITLMIFGSMLIEEIFGADHNILYDISRWGAIVALFYFSFSFLYFMGPSRKMKWKFFSAGSTLATVLSLIVSAGFAWYVQHFGNWNKLYGSIGTLIVVMLWIFFIAFILLIGFELNASIASAKKKKISEEPA